MPAELRVGYGTWASPDGVRNTYAGAVAGGRSAPALVGEAFVVEVSVKEGVEEGVKECVNEDIANESPGDQQTDGNGPRSLPAGEKVSVVETVVAKADVARDQLSYWEKTLVRSCHRVLGSGLGHTAAMCREARVTYGQIELHAREIGVQQKLRPDMLQNLVKFVQFMHLLEKLGVVKFEGSLPGRSVLGHDMISIVWNSKWQAVLEEICGWDKYFRAKSTVYEMLLKFGFGGHRDLPFPEDMVFTGKSTEHKEHVLLYCSTFMFDEVKLGRNLKRYTNKQTKQTTGCGGVNGRGVWNGRDGLCVLLAAAKM